MDKRRNRISMFTKSINKFPNIKKAASLSRITTLKRKNSSNNSLNCKSTIKPTPSIQPSIQSHSSLRTLKSVSSLSKHLSLPSNEPKLPLSSKETLENFAHLLSYDEKAEILNFSTIYFIAKSKKHDTANAVVGDHIKYRYEILGVLGKGTFGVVCKCKDHKTAEIVAVKVINKDKKFTEQARTEIQILQFLKENLSKSKYIVKMLSHFRFRDQTCIVFELLHSDLYSFIRLHRFRGFNLQFVRKFCIQMLLMLETLRKNAIIHCDFKPENLLLRNNKNSQITLIDFGSSCFSSEAIYTYIQSRFYRAPEIMLGIPYSSAIDMWSFACVAVELHKGQPLFPGKCERDLIQRIMEVIGIPPNSVLERASRRNRFFKDGHPILTPNNKGRVRQPYSRTFESAISSSHELFNDFIRKIIVWDPAARLTPKKALMHPWINNSNL